MKYILKRYQQIEDVKMPNYIDTCGFWNCNRKEARLFDTREDAEWFQEMDEDNPVGKLFPVTYEIEEVAE